MRVLELQLGDPQFWRKPEQCPTGGKWVEFLWRGKREVLAGLNKLFINSLNWRNICYIYAIGLSSTSHMLLGKGIFSLVQFLAYFSNSATVQQFYFRVFSKSSARAVTMEVLRSLSSLIQFFSYYLEVLSLSKSHVYVYSIFLSLTF